MTDDISVSQAVESFHSACRASGLRPATRQTYRTKLKPFCTSFGSRHLSTITTADLRRFFTNLRNQPVRWQDHPYIPPQPGGYAPETIYGFFRALRRFFNWCLADGLLQVTPVNGLDVKRERRRVPKGISRGAFTAILRKTEGDSVWQRRNRAIVLLLADTGCRAGGLVNLDVTDINLAERFALVRGKGGRQRFVPISQPTCDALARYMALRPSTLHDPGEKALFISRRTRSRLTTGGLHQLVDRLGARAGVEENVAVHRWRHAFARWYLLNGGDLSTLSDLLGHSSVAITRDYYAIFNREELRRKHQQHSMVARIVRQESIDVKIPAPSGPTLHAQGVSYHGALAGPCCL